VEFFACLHAENRQERRGRPAGRPPRSADADMQMQSRTLMHGHG
jgi:hypothetical protein